jgi:hypothetical protein
LSNYGQNDDSDNVEDYRDHTKLGSDPYLPPHERMKKKTSEFDTVKIKGKIF